MLPRIVLRHATGGQLKKHPNHRLLHSLPSQAFTARRYIWSHLLAGVAGGFVVVGAGYTYYHFSGIKRVIDASKQLRVYLEQTKESILKKHPNEALDYLRQLAKSYVAIIPGAGIAVDRLFDSVAEILEKHHEEASEILAKAQEEVEEVIKQKDQLTTTDLAGRVMAVIGKHVNEIGKLGAKAGGPLLQPVTDKNDQRIGMLKDLFNAGKKKD